MLIFAFQVKISDFITVDVHPAAVPLIWIYHLPINFVGSIIGKGGANQLPSSGFQAGKRLIISFSYEFDLQVSMS